MEATSLRFADAARRLAAVLRARGLAVPAFRSPPRTRGRMRTMRRHRDGSVTVSLVLRDRPWSAVLADMVEGAVVANGCAGAEAEQLRDELWSVFDEPQVRHGRGDGTVSGSVSGSVGEAA